jgi:hypothetical protein
LAWDFLGLSNSQNVLPKEKKEKQIAILIGPIGHAQNRIIYIYIYVGLIFQFCVGFFFVYNCKNTMANLTLIILFSEMM